MTTARVGRCLRLCVGAAVLAAPAFAWADSFYLHELQAKAKVLDLANHPQWHALLHYAPVGGGLESEADDANFFAARRGKHDPAAELAGTLSAFFSGEAVGEREEPAQCAFIARYRWLRSELGFDDTRLPPQRCSRFERWFRTIGAHSLTLVFPTDYLNNPSSMFGHTLLRMDGPPDSQSTPLLAYAVNYGAITGNDGGVTFAVKGLAGGYTGWFSIAPYYEKVREYSDLENRDIWEYALSLTPAEVQRITEHLWELRGTGFDYYFFTENCSYQLLTLLDVARPSLRLARRFDSVWVIPADTIRLLKAEQLLGEAAYRPAATTRLKQDAERLTDAEQRAARDLADFSRDAGKLMGTVTTSDEPADVVELAYDYLRYQHAVGTVRGDAPARHLHALLQRRANIDVSLPRSYVAPAKRPEEGHPTAMVSVGAGNRESSAFQTLRFRPAFHDLLDPPGGYKQGAEIEFADVHLRHLPDDERVRLERLNVVEILSLSPRDLFFEQVSWSVRAGWDRRTLPLPDADDELTFAFEGGAGFAWQPGSSALTYALLELNLEQNSEFDHAYAFGPGVRIGAQMQFPAGLQIGLIARYTEYGGGHVFGRSEAALHVRRTLGFRNQLELVLARQGAKRETRREGFVAWRHYF